MNVNGKKVFLDTENAVTIYYKLTQFFSDVSILESVIGGENKGRYSIILFNVYEDIEIYQDIALIDGKKTKIKSPSNFIKKIYTKEKIKNFYKENIPIPFIIGNLSFDLCKFTLPKLKYKSSKNDLDIPLAHFVRPKNIIVIDNILNETHLLEISNNNTSKKSLSRIEGILFSNKTLQKKNKNKETPKLFKSHMNKEDFIDKVSKIKNEIVKGEIFQAVLSQRFSAPYNIDPFDFTEH